MTSLAQILVDLGKTVRGCDVAEAFVTQRILDTLPILIDTGFENTLPQDTDCVIFTAAHQGADNPLVKKAVALNIPTYSQAEALGEVFNAQKGVAVCGVGGKSTTSAMITWILSKLGYNPSFSVGVGAIIGLEKTGNWNPDSDFFIAEADEYVTNPQEVQKGAAPVPRFSYLHPYCTVCTNYSYDHPDVYKSFEETKEAFTNFFTNIKPDGVLIVNHKDLPHLTTHSAPTVQSFGTSEDCDYSYTYIEAESKPGSTRATIRAHGTQYDLTLTVPGRYNVENAVAALAACDAIGIPLEAAVAALETFNSTQRRFEYKGEKNGVTFFDDYAHHPSEIKAVLDAVATWYTDHEVYIAFQPHTYSRTLSLLDDFATVLRTAPNLLLLEIFASAREPKTDAVSSNLLKETILKKGYTQEIPVFKDYTELAEHCKKLPKGSVCITLGAGDIYKVHSLE